FNESPTNGLIIQNLRATLAGSKSSSEAGLAYQRAFSKLNRLEIRRLAFDPNDSIAIQAQFEQSKSADAKDTRLASQRFFGFVEGRCHTEIPIHWELALVMQQLGAKGRTREQLLEEYLPKCSSLKRKGPRIVYVSEEVTMNDILKVEIPTNVKV